MLGSCIMPRDESIPQSSEGDVTMSVAITPVDAKDMLTITEVARVGDKSGLFATLHYNIT